MPFTRHDLWRIFRIVAVITAVVLTLSPTPHRAVYAASFNPEINYQGKLSDNTGAAVDDDGYNMRFRLYDVATSGSPLWTEVWCYSPDSGATCNGTGTDQRVDVINGLFSVLLGDITALSSVDFNDELWLEVSIGATGTSPTWEDLSPRKKLASVPAAFQADQLDGVDSLQFLRSDEPDTMNASSSATLLTIDQDGSGDILNVVGGSTEYFTVLSSGNVGINNDAPGNQLSVGGDIGITTDSADLRFYQGSNYVGFQASSSLSGSQIWTLPTTDATTAGQALISDAAGNLSWATAGVSNYLSLTDTPGSFTANRVPFTNSAGSALTDSDDLVFDDGTDQLMIGDVLVRGYSTNSLSIGPSAGTAAGALNTFIGSGAGSSATSTAQGNVAVGANAGVSFTGLSNVAVGVSAGPVNTGNTNVFIGAISGLTNASGTNNVFVGAGSGGSNNGSGNVFLGNGAGQTLTTASNTLVIGNSAFSELIYGDFSTGRVRLAGNLELSGTSNEIRFYEGSNYVGFEAPALSGDQIWVLPDSDGTGNQVLATDGSGNLSWIDGSAATGSVAAYLDLSDTPGSFTASAIPFTDTGGTELLHSSSLTFTDTNDILTIGSQRIFGIATRNLFIGEGAGNTTLSGALDNVGIGYNAGVAITSGDDNTFVGAWSGSANTTGRFNTFLGRGAGGGNISSNSVIAIGYLTASSPTSTSASSVLIGNSVLRNGQGGVSNTIIGDTAGRYTDAGENTFVGANVGTGISGQSTGDQNVFIGRYAGQNYQTTDRSVLIGYTAGQNAATTTLNTFIGFQAGQDALGDTNVFVGANAGKVTESDGNVFVGFQAGVNNTSGYSNTYIGQDAGRNGSTANRNTFVGHDAGFNVTTGNLNTLLGWRAGDALTEGSGNVLLGVNAGGAQTTANNNTIIGYNAGLTNVAGTANVFLGYQAGQNETGSDRLYIANSNTADPLIYGEFDNSLLVVSGNLFVADQASSDELQFGVKGDTAKASIELVRSANDGDLVFKTTTSVAAPAERLRITHDGNIQIGGSNNELRFYEGVNYVGFEAPALSADQIWVLPDADATTSGQVLTSDGAGNLSWTTPSAGGASSYLGLSDTPGSFTAGAVPFASSSASSLIHSSSFTFTTASNILSVGGARLFTGSGASNIFLGQNAGNTTQSNEANVFIGPSAGGALTNGANNTAVGQGVGALLTSGSNNVLLGYQAGNTLTTGSTNILIGYDVDVTSNSASNQLNIGNLVYGDLSSGQLSVGTSTLSHTLAVAGTFDVNSGAINYATTTNITSIERLNLGNIEFEENAGAVSWFDLPVTSAAATGTIMSYVAQIDSNEILKLYSESDGSGGIDTTRVVIGSASSAVLGSSNIPDGSLIVAGGALCVDNGSADNCDDAALTSGQIYAESTSVTAIDLAENFPTKDPSLEAAELVMLDPDNPVYVKTYDPADPKARLLGVVSTKPGVLLGGFGSERFQEDRKVPVALAGRVPIKVMLSETGPVEVGDRLSMSEIPGVATKAGAFSQTVGIALESIEEGAEGVQEILVFVNLQNGGSEGAGGVVGLNDQLRAFGVQIGQEVTRIARLIVGKLTVGTPQNPTGITIYDMNTRQPYCIKILNGQHVATPGSCEEVDTTNFFENTGGVESASSTGSGGAPASESGTTPGADANNGGSSGTSNPPAETPSSTDNGAGDTSTSTDSGADGAPTSTASGVDTTPTTTTSGAPTTTSSGTGTPTPTTTDSGANPPVTDPVPESTPEPEVLPESEPATPPASAPSSTSSS